MAIETGILIVQSGSTKTTTKVEVPCPEKGKVFRLDEVRYYVGNIGNSGQSNLPVESNAIFGVTPFDASAQFFNSLDAINGRSLAIQYLASDYTAVNEWDGSTEYVTKSMSSHFVPGGIALLTRFPAYFVGDIWAYIVAPEMFIHGGLTVTFAIEYTEVTGNDRIFRELAARCYP